MAAPIVRIKRSSQAGKIPTTGQLLLGEFAINTTDGKVYIEHEKDGVGIGTTVIAINPWNVGLGSDAYDINFTAGDVGIGTTDPQAKLDVNGDVSIASTVSIGTTIDIVPYNNLGSLSFEGSAGQLFSITNNLTSGSIFSVNDVSGIPSIDVDADGTIQLAPFGSTEYVGIGTTNPQEKLDVVGNIRMSAVPGTNTNVDLPVLFQTTTGTIDGGSSLTFNPAGDTLKINGLTISSNLIYGNGSALTLTTQNGNGVTQYEATNTTLSLKTNSIVRLRVDAAGNVGIGTSAPIATLDVNGTIGAGGSTGTSGQVLKSTGTGIEWANESGGGSSDWTRKTGAYTAVSGDKIIADTTGGAFTITLPASPTEGNSVVIGDGGDWSTNNLTVARNGSNIEGVADDLTLDLGGITVEIVYEDATDGWQVYASAGPSVPITDDTTTNATRYLAFTDATSGIVSTAYVSSTKLQFNPSTGILTATEFSGSGASLNSIPNAALDNSTVSYGGVLLSLGGSDATPAFDLSDATNYPYTSFTGITTDIVGDTTPQLGGDLDLNGNDITGTGNINITGNLNVSGVSTFQSNVDLGDNDRLRLGDSQDLQIYHTGSNSIIQDTGDGDLFLSADDVVRITNSAFTETKALFTTNGSVELYYDNSLKFETTTTGIEVSNGASTSATIAGPDEIIIDPATVGDNTGSVRIKGDLYVDGTTTQINSTTIELADFIVGIATTATTDTLADGAGIQIGPDNTFLYEYNGGTNPSLKSSENLNVASGKHYQIGETEVLNATTLGSGVVNSSLTSLGTIATGVWQGTAIDDTYIGTINNADKVSLSALDIDGGTATTTIVDDDLLIVDDGANGTNRKITALNAKNYFAVGSSSVSLADESSDTTCFPVFANDATGDQALKTDSSSLTYNASTGQLSAVDFNTTSDKKLKGNIKTIENPLEKLSEIRGVDFKWKKTKKQSAGVIAQEIEKVLPHLVSGNDVKGVNYNGLVGLLIEVVKEQQSQIDTLSERLSKLE